MTALGSAVNDAYKRGRDAAWKRGFAAGWYAAQLEQAREQEHSQPADFPLEIEGGQPDGG